LNYTKTADDDKKLGADNKYFTDLANSLPTYDSGDKLNLAELIH